MYPVSRPCNLEDGKAFEESPISPRYSSKNDYFARLTIVEAPAKLGLIFFRI